MSARKPPAARMTSPPRRQVPSGGSGWPKSLEGWLADADKLHPRQIGLSLDRVASVAERMRLRLEMPITTVTGTNGNGSACAILEAMLRAAGWCQRARYGDGGVGK